MKLKTISCHGTWRYYCSYCDKDITPPSGHKKIGYFNCIHCPTSVMFIVFGDISEPEIGYTQIRVSNHLIELNYYDNKVVIWSEHTSRSRRLMELDYIPDITPSTAAQWLERLYKIKAFS